MAPVKHSSNRLSNLRKRAEAALKKRREEIPDIQDEQVKRLVHELQTHEIELELQNEELRLTQERLDEQREKYLTLFDFAPVGYLTSNHDGLVLEANLPATELLGVEREKLRNKPITRFILADDQDIFYRHRQALVDTRRPRSCELRMKKKERSVFWAMMQCVISNPDQPAGLFLFFTTITDISQKKENEQRLQNTVSELNQFNRMMVDREIRMVELKRRINGLLKRLGEGPEFPV